LKVRRKWNVNIGEHKMNYLYSSTRISTSTELLIPGTLTGHGNNLYRMPTCWLPEFVRYASVRRLQSVGEAQTGPAGYQTDTGFIRAGL